MNIYLAGSTSVIETVFLQDSTSTAGAGKSGLVFNTAGLELWYRRSTDTAWTQVTLVTITTLGTYASGGFKEEDSTHSVGDYEFHPPNAAMAAGAAWVKFRFKGATGLVARTVKYRLISADLDNATDLGLKALKPFAAATGSVNDAGDLSSGQFVTTLTQTVDDYWKDASLYFISGTLTGQMAAITGYVGSTKKITLDLTKLTGTIPNSAQFVIVQQPRRFPSNFHKIPVDGTTGYVSADTKAVGGVTAVSTIAILKRNVAYGEFAFPMVLADGVDTPAPSGTVVSVKRLADGTDVGNVTNAPVFKVLGAWSVNIVAADLNVQDNFFYASAAGCKTFWWKLITQ